MDEKKKVRIVLDPPEKRWTSSYTYALSRAGKEASAAAIREAAKKGIPISYWKDGEVVTEYLPPEDLK